MTFKYFTCDKREGPQGHWPSGVLTGRGPSLVGATPLTLQQTKSDQIKNHVHNNNIVQTNKKTLLQINYIYISDQ